MMVIDTNSAEVKPVKLSSDDLKQLKQYLKMHEDSEVLLRIFKLFNLFYEKFSHAQPEEAKQQEQVEEGPKREEIVKQIEHFYGSEKVELFVHEMNDVLKIVQNANIDITDTISNLIFCVFASFFPEVY